MPRKKTPEKIWGQYKGDKYAAIYENRMRYCVDFCPYWDRKECRQCFDFQNNKPKERKRLTLDAIGLGWTEEEARDMFCYRGELG